MSQTKMSVILKSISVVAIVMVTLFLTILMPILALECKATYDEVAYLFWPGLAYGWFIGGICYAALYQFWKICNEIAKDNSFSKENIKSLKIISGLGLFAAIVWFAGIVALIIMKCIGIGFFALMIFAIIVSLMISILAVALAHLVQKAYELKEEVELTI